MSTWLVILYVSLFVIGFGGVGLAGYIFGYDKGFANALDAIDDILKLRNIDNGDEREGNK